MAERRITLSKPNYTAPVVDGSADLSGAKGSIKVEAKNPAWVGWNDVTDDYIFTYELIDSNEGSASTPIEIGESENQYVTGYQASSDTWRGTSAEFLITAIHDVPLGNDDLTANFNIVVTDPYYEEPPAGLGGTPPPPPPPPPPDPTESDENRAGDGAVDDGLTLEYTTGIKVLEDVMPGSPLVYDGRDLIITLDLKNIIYKPSALDEIISPAFKSY